MGRVWLKGKEEESGSYEEEGRGEEEGEDVLV